MALKFNPLNGNLDLVNANSTLFVNSLPVKTLRARLAASKVLATRIVYIGSSTTAGFNATALSKRYTNLLTTAIQNAYPAVGKIEPAVVTSTAASFGTLITTPGVHGYNAGIAGTTSSNYTTSGTRASIAAITPAGIIHMIGSNDYSTNVNPATFKTNVQAAITAFKAACDAKHILIQSYARQDVVAPTYTWEQYGTALSEIAAADPDNVSYLDISAVYANLGIPGADPYDLLDTDNIHQTNTGHAVMADSVRAALGIDSSVPLNQTLYASDTFTRADGAVGNAEFGGAWSVLAGTFAINTNQLQATAAGNIVMDSGVNNNLDISVDCIYNGQTMGILFRVLDTNNRFGAFLDTLLGAAVYKTSGGVTTNLASSRATWTSGTTYRLRVTVIDDVIKMYVDGKLMLTYTMSGADYTTFGGYTIIGLRQSVTAASARFDNWSAYSTAIVQVTYMPKSANVINAPGATPFSNTDNCSSMDYTGINAAITSMTTNLVGTPARGDTMDYSFTDDGTPRAITWGASFEASTIPLPTTTVISTRLEARFKWNVVTSKWRLMSVA